MCSKLSPSDFGNRGRGNNSKQRTDGRGTETDLGRMAATPQVDKPVALQKSGQLPSCVMWRTVFGSRLL